MTYSRIKSAQELNPTEFTVTREQNKIDIDNIPATVNSFIVEDGNPYFSVENGVLYNFEKTKIVAVPPSFNAQDFAIPESVTSLGWRAFSHCLLLKRLFIPSNVRTIEDDCFRWNHNLEEVVIDNGLELIGRNCFIDNKQLKRVVLPETLKVIEYRAFCYCNELEDITLPSSLQVIGEQAFYGCRCNSSLTIPASVKAIGYHAFSNWALKKLTFFGVPEKIDSGTSDYDHPFYYQGRTEIEIPEGSVEKFKKLFPKNSWHQFVYPKREDAEPLPKFINIKDAMGCERAINTDLIVKVMLEDDREVKIQMVDDDKPIKVNRVDFIDWINYFK